MAGESFDESFPDFESTLYPVTQPPSRRVMRNKENIRDAGELQPCSCASRLLAEAPLARPYSWQLEAWGAACKPAVARRPVDSPAVQRVDKIYLLRARTRPHASAKPVVVCLD